MTGDRSTALPTHTEIVVLGGGLAGLAAAVTLERAGLSVELLEASDRVGGRVKTLRAPFDDGLFAESGAEFISPGHAVTRTFLRRYGLEVRARPTAPRRYCFGGRTLLGDSPAEYGGQVARELEALARRTFQLAERVPDPGQSWASLDAAELDRECLAGWLDLPRLDPITRGYLRTWTTLDYATEAENISLLMYARDERLIQLSPAHEAVCAPHGLELLPRAMAAELGSDAHLWTSAREVEQEAHLKRVSVRYEVEGTSGRLEADHAIVALPLTTLRNLVFSPPLDSDPEAAIREIRFGQVTKTHLQFRRRFWNDQGETVGTMTDLGFQSAWDSTHAQPGPRGILTIYTAGQRAAKLAELPEEERVTRCLRQLEEIYPGCGTDFERGVSVVWADESLARGAYSYFGPGQMTRHGPWLARPQGRIYFAGEHTDPWQATMNGALASGVRAAEEVLAHRNQ